MSWQQSISAALTKRDKQGLLRQRIQVGPNDGRHIEIDGRRYFHFSGNDYLGLSHDARVIHAWQQGAERYGVGAGASGHVTGYTAAHAALEHELADWLGYQQALLFISGFAANQAVISALPGKDDRILADKLTHASILEAASLSPATLRRFGHNQPDALHSLLTSSHSGNTLVVTEGVFSMDGDRAPLASLAALTQSSDRWLMVDDAHGIGVMGEQGRGSCWQQQVKPELLIVTFGKAFGVSGAAVLCSNETADYLLQFARHLIYSTAMPAAQACALQAALHCIQAGDALREQLQRNIASFCQGVTSLNYGPGVGSDTAIQPLIIGDDREALVVAQRLRESGFWVSAIRPPTVPAGTARLRITLNARHQPQDIDALLEALYAARC